MKIKMLKTAAGPSGVKLPGRVYDVSEKEAKALAACKAAVILEPKKVETASIEPAEVEVKEKAEAETAEPAEKEANPKPSKSGKGKK